ncbi:UPF0496 protein 1-like [Canna indica]|uniref:UPF0496 protein 1-like n=1 Tax=Canna indica TaxID=4628 RepID=A0AAQ3KLW5_9LILI|nr:UPF0496 protein 1-like [Canna indica]
MDASLLSRTNTVVSTVNDMSSDGSLSSRAVEVATDGFLYVNGLFVELSSAIKRDPDLCECVKEYLSSTDEILNSFEAFKHCLENARDAKGILKDATEYFMHKDYENAEKELHKFNRLADPFRSTEFIDNLRSNCERQKEKLERLLEQYGDKIKTVEEWRSVWKVVFLSSIIITCICAAVAVVAPPAAILTVAASAASVVVGLWPLVTEIWSNKKAELLSVKDAVDAMQKQMFTNKTELTSIKKSVDYLQEKIGAMKSSYVEMKPTAAEVDKLECVVKDIKKRMGAFKRNLKKLEKVDRSSEDIRKKKEEILEKIKGDNCTKLSWHKRLIRSCSCCTNSNQEVKED